MRPSILCRIIRFLLRRFLQPVFYSEASLERFVRILRKQPLPPVPKGAISLPDLPCVTYLFPQPPPRAGQAAPGCTVLYLHGSAYVAPGTKGHILFAEFFQRRLGAAVLMPFYPLAPENSGDTAVLAVERVYAEACRIAQGGPVCLMGDSAGAGLALALAQRLCCCGVGVGGSAGGSAAASSLPRPAALFLVSPWLDATMTHPDIPAVGKLDPWLAAPGLAAAGRWYAGRNGDPANLVASPGRGPIAGLPPTSIWVAGHDTLTPDCELFRRKWVAAAAHAAAPAGTGGSAAAPPRSSGGEAGGVSRLRYYEAEGGAFHAFPLFRVLWLPEATEACEQMVAAIAEDVREWRAAVSGGEGPGAAPGSRL